MTAQLTYGLKDNQLIHVDKVENGLACGCICANCKSPLVARNGGKDRAHHFAHHNINECEGAFETALHLLAKQVFSKKKKLTTPSVHHYTRRLNQSIEIYKSKKITFESVELEKRLNVNNTFIVPDAIGYISGKPMFLVEFAHTHFIDDTKYLKIKESGLICIEINLFGTELSEKAIEQLLDSPWDIKWINYPKLFDSIEQIANKKIKELEEKEKREKQRLIQLENERKEKNKQLLKKYNMDFEVELIPSKKTALYCPIVHRSLKSLIDTNFYAHSILKRIIDGEYWNGEIYGKTYEYHSYGKYIFLKNEKIYIYPDETEYDYSSQKQYDFFYRGVNEIIRIREKADCYNCKHCLDRIPTDNFENIIVCGYNKRKLLLH